ncbi:alanine--tRNA ligase [Enterobacteriaceae endosymbiont of Plateumaris consimilis]|uniref:alanine--tRNA ligase n=1 Tax=Enterobacteriaceae endosymbiont of Plateumaris consimilis TaxID=2675794 RepID=UPI001449FA86|nr:alanine--tRNA ligase [Enterobacteriaceae endosymbiont of Plateumaris consimilis]QJC28453.1 alanine--tRNA ligase [Enterobacteriaceae endosymbiont of Plateumaris consimilis]
MVKTTNEISKIFLNYFSDKKHIIMKGSSLIPQNDSSLLFTNAGMNQFKEFFLGNKQSNQSRIVTIQKCIRIGGKHNDLENVGFTNRHHTFFEMLGNFSFGDYFKKEAIYYAWELLTDSKWFNLNKKKIFVTVYYTDKETYNIWYKHIGVLKKNIILIGDKNNILYNSDNFWQMDNTGPCGPSTEIFYDLGEHLSGDIINNTGNRFIEIWNIVFIQFNKTSYGKLIPLNIKSVDTGMGLERISCVLQGFDSNYQLNIFKKLIKYIATITNTTNLENNSLKVIADHIRSTVYLIYEGILPSNENRGYALRKIIRRAINHGKMLGQKKPFFYKIVKIFIENISIDSKIIKLDEKCKFIEKIIQNEEKNFEKILKNGTILLNKEIKKLKTNILSGKKVFYLYDTFGVSIDLIKSICKKKNIDINQKEYNQYMDIQRNLARKNNLFKNNQKSHYINKKSKFEGYCKFETNSRILDIYINNKLTNKIHKGEKGVIILNITPFYGESGGQIGDIGYLEKDQNNLFKVCNTKINKDLILHIGEMISGTLVVNDNLKAKINIDFRQNISRNHSVTHLLHACLRKLLGEHVQQKGSYITDTYLRFDFSYFKNLDFLFLLKIEKMINNYIFDNIPVKIYTINKYIAKKNENIISLFDEKYGDIVRIVEIEKISKEYCGGTHILNTNQIGFFIIKKFSNISHGIKRIHAITHDYSLQYIQKQNERLKLIIDIFKTNKAHLIEKILIYKNKRSILKKSLNNLEQYFIENESKILLSNNIFSQNINFIISNIYNFHPKLFHLFLKNLISKINNFIIILSTKWDNNYYIMIKISNNLANNINVIKIINKLCDKNHCKIGGCVTIAQINCDFNEIQFNLFLTKIKSFFLNYIKN